MLNIWAENCNVYIEAKIGFRSKVSTIDNRYVFKWLNFALYGPRKVIIHIVNPYPANTERTFCEGI